MAGWFRMKLIEISQLRREHFRIYSIICVCVMLIVAFYRYIVSLEGEGEIVNAALADTVSAMARVIGLHIERDLGYQDQVANLWSLIPDISREKFREFIISPAFIPISDTMAGMSLIRYFNGSNRSQFEQNNEAFVKECCAGLCANHVYCEEQRFMVMETVNGAFGESPPQDSYLVVDYIEPLASNIGALGFNLASNAARLEAWQNATKSGQKVFTRRLTLMQTGGTEFGILVWQALFKSKDNSKIVFKSNENASTQAVGSINGVYLTQQLLDKSLNVFKKDDELGGLNIYLMDSQGSDGNQLLASFGNFTEDQQASNRNLNLWDFPDRALSSNIHVPNSSASLVLVVEPDKSYVSKRTSDMPLVLLMWSLLLVCLAQMERSLGFLAGAARKTDPTISPEPVTRKEFLAEKSVDFEIKKC